MRQHLVLTQKIVFWGNFERMEGYVTILHLFAYFVVVGSTLSTEKLWTRLLHTSLGASVIASVYALIQIAGLLTINQGGVRVDATFGNSAYFAIYLLFHIFIALILLMRPHEKHMGQVSVWCYCTCSDVPTVPNRNTWCNAGSSWWAPSFGASHCNL